MESEDGNPVHSDLNQRFLTLLHELHEEVLAKAGRVGPLALLINDTAARVYDMQGETRFIDGNQWIMQSNLKRWRKMRKEKKNDQTREVTQTSFISL